MNPAFASFFQSYPEAAILVGPALRVAQMNVRALLVFGEDCPGKRMEEVFPELVPLLSNPDSQDGNAIVFERAGRYYKAEVSATDQGEFFAILRDLTKEYTVQTELENRFQVMADSAPVMIWMSRTDKLCDWFNKPWLNYTGRTLEQEWGNGWTEGIHPDDLDRVMRVYAAAFDARQPFAIDYRLRRHDGVYRWILDNGAPRYGPDGVFTGYIGGSADIHDRKSMERQLEIDAAALQVADRRKNEFIAMLSHELRNPLGPIASAAEVLQLAGKANPVITQVKDVLKRQVNHMGRLIDDLLDVSRVTRGKISLHKAPAVLGDVVANALELADTRIKAGKFEISTSLPNERRQIICDSVRLTQVIANLIDNAAKYSPPGSRIDVGAQITNGLISVRVTDHGEGIAPEFLPHIFELFSQYDHDQSEARGGLGVGLTIASVIADLHGGELTVASEGKGQGAQFELRFPAEFAEARAA